MKAVKACLLIAGLLLVIHIDADAQQTKPKQTKPQQAKADITQHEQKVRDMVKFLEYVLNTLGSATTSARDKDVLVTESYTKIFRDGKVQVEDDLVEKRNVITNKDVQAYLKDVDFFFDDVKFEFNVKEIKGSLNANDKLFYKVSLIRNMRGMTVEGVAVNNTSPRFIEINYDPKDKDLKIVSIYTKEFDQRAALLSWWKSLSLEWQTFFKKKLNLTADSIQLNDIQNVIAINAVDLSQNRYLKDLEPLTQLVDLQVLNLSNTSVTDVSALRNLTGLVELNIANTKVDDIAPLKYSDNMVKLNISNTAVTDISAIERMSKLEALEMRNTPVTDFTPLANAVSLKYLDLKNTKIISLAPIASLSNLTELNVSRSLVDDLTPLTTLKKMSVLSLDSTGARNLSALSGLDSLSTLAVNYTMVSDLGPLKGLKKLERIYCDHTQIKRTLADAFMLSSPAVLVIFDSEDLRGWWDALPDSWKTVFMSSTKIGKIPSNEELARIPNVDSLNVSGNSGIRDLEPLRKLQKLQVLVANKTSVADLAPLRDHRALRLLDVSQTKVSNIDVASNFTKMTVFRADKTPISNIDALANISGLKILYADNTGISDSLVQLFLHKQPQCLVVFKTDTLMSWWDDLPGAWKDVFEQQSKISPDSRKEDLHKLVEMESLHVKDASVSNLSVLVEFVRLKEVDFSGTAINDMSPLINVKPLRILRATNSPIRNLEALRSMPLLTDVDVSNTPVEDLRPMHGLEALKSFNCSGTQVSSLTPLEDMRSLEYLDCSNTSVKKIDALETVPLKSLKCYNTKISSKTVASYKREHPQCTITHY
ncbi:MAG TPA: leucine-rich repeat domain-containing protein [Chryseolinea sp.]|nr:leucine-rich repeat domain-containing protein [Chryseolinea sp.]